MSRLSEAVDRLMTWPRLLAALLGALAATGFQPLGLWPLTLLAFAGLIELLARADGWRRTALLGWLFGLGHFTVGNNWIATAFTYQANMPAWLGWIAVVLLACYLAVYPALAALGAWLIARRNRQFTAIALGGCWIVCEWLRSWVFTGFAWNPLGAVLLGGFDNPGLAGIATYTGTYGMAGLVILLAWEIRVRPGLILSSRGVARAGHIVAAIVIIGLLATLVVPLPCCSPRQGNLAFTLAQPDIRQEALNDPATFDAQFRRLAGLTTAKSPGRQRLVLWPESGVPDYLREGYPERYYLDNFGADPALSRQRIARAIGPGSMLLTGTVDLEIENGRVAGARNAVTALDDTGAIRGGYFKAHLVPYGEYLALRWLLEPLGASRLVPGGIDFWAGPGPRTLDLGGWGKAPNVKAGVQICYEIIFSGQVVDRAHRPDFIFNPSNDGWFGAWGPPQHLAQARLRAIEEGLPVLRATTTGISAVIDADGIVRQHLPRHVAGRLDGTIPPAHPPTLFARFGNLLALGWAVAFLGASLVASRRRSR